MARVRRRLGGALLENLHERIHRDLPAQPSKQAYIAKKDGKLRPLGIATLEEKIAQQAVVRGP